MGEDWWAARHNAIVQGLEKSRDAQLLFVGDSITSNYDKSNPPDENFQPVWQQYYAPRRALNLGFSGDTTANVLWRLEHGEIDGLHPKAVVLLIGTNNTGWRNQSAEETQVGIDAVVASLENRLPGTRILLLGILPSAISAEKSTRDATINNYLSECYGENPRVTYLDIGSIFYKGDGQLNTSIFYDPRLPQHGKPLHPDTAGQRLMAEAIEPTLAQLMDEAPRVSLTEMTGNNTALIPVPRLERDSYDWFARHHAELATGPKLKPQFLMVGDSITHFWSGPPNSRNANGPLAWTSAFQDKPVLNLGFGWDRTQNVLWRFRQGELDGLQPQWVVLLIGTNNLTGSANARANTPAETAAAVIAVYDELHRRLPQSRIVVMAILPRGSSPDGLLRNPIAATNQLLAKRFGSDRNTVYLDIGPQFLSTDGHLPVELMPDGTHPSEAGYQIWANALNKAFWQ